MPVSLRPPRAAMSVSLIVAVTTPVVSPSTTFASLTDTDASLSVAA